MKVQMTRFKVGIKIFIYKIYVINAEKKSLLQIILEYHGARRLNAKNLKYFDLDAVNMNTWTRKCGIQRKYLTYANLKPVDVSYWNTYHATAPCKTYYTRRKHNATQRSTIIYPESVFFLLLNEYITETSILGIRNLRTDSMNDMEFDLMDVSNDDVNHTEYLNNDWKTAHLNSVFYDNPHWNLYHAEDDKKD
jgi:hypothetical protein